MRQYNDKRAVARGRYTMAAVPFDQRDGFIWFNGEFVPWKDAKVHVLTHGCTMPAPSSRASAPMAARSSSSPSTPSGCSIRREMLGMKIPYSVAEIDDACRDAAEEQGFQDAYVRPIAWRGSEMMGVSAQNNRINVAIAIWQWPAISIRRRSSKGIRLDMAE